MVRVIVLVFHVKIFFLKLSQILLFLPNKSYDGGVDAPKPNCTVICATFHVHTNA